MDEEMEAQRWSVLAQGHTASERQSLASSRALPDSAVPGGLSDDSQSHLLQREQVTSVPWPSHSGRESLCSVVGLQRLWPSLKRCPHLLLPWRAAERCLCAHLPRWARGEDSSGWRRGVGRQVGTQLSPNVINCPFYPPQQALGSYGSSYFCLTPFSADSWWLWQASCLCPFLGLLPDITVQRKHRDPGPRAFRSQPCRSLCGFGPILSSHKTLVSSRTRLVILFFTGCGSIYKLKHSFNWYAGHRLKGWTESTLARWELTL